MGSNAGPGARAPGIGVGRIEATGALAILLFLVGCSGIGRLERATDDRAESEEGWAEMALERLPMLDLCEIPDAPEPLLCGRLPVPEDRARPEGRRIELSIVVVPARSESPPSDPVFVFEGGPGGAVTRRAIGSIYAGPVRQRDIVLVDQRGTGGSHSIHCDLGEGRNAVGELRQMYPPEAVRTCAAALAERADVRLYGSVQHADDIEEARRWLGYGPINIRGGSYGTRAMMVFAQRYPESTRSLFGIGVVSPLVSHLSVRGQNAERALAGIGWLCASQPSCAALVPDLAGLAAKVLGQLEDRPRRLELRDPLDSAETIVVQVERAWLAEMLRLNLYFAATSRALPWAFHRAHAEQDWEPLVQLSLLIEQTFRSALSTGVALTVQCSEAMDFDADEAVARGSQTLFGSYRLRQQIQGCDAWPHEVKPALGVDRPRVLGIPTFFLSGRWDAVTPPHYAEQARSFFPNSEHLVLEEGQHGPFDLEQGWECVHRIWAEFLASGRVEGLDTHCAGAMHRQSFLVDEESFRDHVETVLAPMAR
ncbi:MAG: alpha/beta hydrolase [Holophagales bacterium]|nr:alpha/beta hydrolase [Holophagales bacterium]